jgi:isopentenyl-diphosphate delta-isomerase
MATNRKVITIRKADHLRICLTKDVRSGITNGLEKYRFTHQALPEMDFQDISTEVSFLNKRLKLPILISSITGGTKQAGQINMNLAKAAEQHQICFALGSLRAALENPRTASSYQIRKVAPTTVVYANLGAVQLNYGFGVEECKKIIELVQADGLVLHLNPLQEVLQPEGDNNFSGLLKKIEVICNSIPVPVIVKEVGWGISREIAKQLYQAGVKAIDVAGAGGTSWSQVEMFRARNTVYSEAAKAFKDWGLTTAESIIQTRSISKKLRIIASGGIRNGVEIAKCIALGANLVGLARLFLGPAMISSEEVVRTIDVLALQFRAAMFVAGKYNITQLTKTKLLEMR